MSIELFFNEEEKKKNYVIDFINLLYEKNQMLEMELNSLKMKPEIKRIKELEEENNKLCRENNNFKYANELSFNNKELDIIENWDYNHKEEQRKTGEIKLHFLRYTIYLTKAGLVKKGECDCGCYIEIRNGEVIKKGVK